MEPRAVRVGIVQTGTLVEERLVLGDGGITVGRGGRCTFVLPAPGLPQRWRLLERRGGRYRLRLAPGMEAKIAAGRGVAEVAAGALVPLPDAARGKVAIGDLSILFQLVTPPRPRPRPRLPASLRQAPLAAVDRVFAIVAALSLLAHVALVVYLQRVDWPRRVEVEEVPDYFVRHVIRQPPKPLPPAATPSAPSAAAGPRAARPAPARPAPSREERLARLREQVNRVGVLSVIGAAGPGGSLLDTLIPGGIDRDQDEAFRNIGGLTVASEGSLRGLAPATGTGRIAGVRDLAGHAPGIRAADVGPARAERQVSVIRVEPPEPVEGFDPSQLARLVRARLHDVRACYERALKRRPELAGKIILRFTLTAAGTVSDADIDDQSLGDAEVTSCIRNAVLRWRFPAPPRAGVELVFPFVFQASN